MERYAREIVPAFNAYLYFRIGYWIGRKVAQGLYRVRLGFVDTEALKKVPENATVVFVMNHRSNMDYILAGYLAADQAALSYAVGEWARAWPLSALIRSMGAYFVRRNSKDELYRRVLERYIVMATQAGVPQAVFPEGGLTRDGLMREPRLGVVDYMLRGFWLDGARDLVFVPARAELRPRAGGPARCCCRSTPTRANRTVSGPSGTPSGFVTNNLRLMLKSDWHRFGYACVNFGAPVSMREYCTLRGLDFQKLSGEQRKRAIGDLGTHLMSRVGRIVPVVPVPLIASVLLTNSPKPISEFELKAAVEQLIEKLEAAGAHVYIPRKDLDYAVTVGLRMLTLRHVVEEKEGLFVGRAPDLPLIRYYANSIAHLLR